MTMQDSTTAVSHGVVQLIVGASIETQVVLAICAIFSLISWYIIAAKWWRFRQLNSWRNEFFRTVDRVRNTEDRLDAIKSLPDSPFRDVLRNTASYLADLRASQQRDGVARSGLSLTQLEAMTQTLDAGIGDSVDDTRRMLPWLAIVGSTAPLLGLFGTVIGIINAFLGIAAKGTGNIAAVGPGIADALVATAAGLAAAIPAVIAYNVFTGRSERFEGELERLAQDTIGAMGREGRL